MDYKFNMSDIVEIEMPEVERCKGLIYRGYHSKYIDNKGLHVRQGFKLLKRKSCTGCIKCGFLIDSMMEVPDSIIYPEIENGKLYSCCVTNESRDWETGYIDDYDIEFYEVKE